MPERSFLGIGDQQNLCTCDEATAAVQSFAADFRDFSDETN